MDDTINRGEVFLLFCLYIRLHIVQDVDELTLMFHLSPLPSLVIEGQSHFVHPVNSLQSHEILELQYLSMEHLSNRLVALSSSQDEK